MTILIIFLFLVIKYPKDWVFKFTLNLPLILSLYIFLPGRRIPIPFFEDIDISVFILTLWVLANLKKGVIIKHFFWINTFCTFILFLIFFSTDKIASLTHVLGVVVYLYSFIIYYNYFSTNTQNPIHDMKYIFKQSMLFSIIFIAYFFFFYLQNPSVLETYEGSSFEIGKLSLYGMYPFIYMASVGLLFIEKPKNILIIGAKIIFMIILFLLVSKRTYLLILILSVLLPYLFFIVYAKKIKHLFLVAILSLPAFFILQKPIDNLLNKREEVDEQSYGDTGRFSEFIAFNELVILRNEKMKMYFGDEILNPGAVDFSGSNQLVLAHDDERILHSDYSFILYGGGFVGISLYLILFLIILFLGIKEFVKINKSEFNIKLFSVFISSFVALLLNGLSDGILFWGNRIIAFMIMGIILGYFTRKNNQVTNA